MANPSQLEVVYGLCKNKEFRQQWECLYDKTMKYVRIHCVELWGDNIWQDVIKFHVEGQEEIVKKYAEDLLSSVVKHFDEKIEKCEPGLFSEKMSLSVTRDDLKRTYEDDPYKFIETLVRCLSEEEILINSFTKPSEEQLQQENITQILKHLQKSEELEQSLIQKVKTLGSLLDEERKKYLELNKKEREKQDATLTADSSRKKNGINSVNLPEIIQGEIQNMNGRLKQIDVEMQRLKVGIKDVLKQLLSNGNELEKRFSEVITKWKKQSKFKYVSLEESDYSLNGVDDRCKKYGKLLHTTLHFIQDDLMVLSNPKWEMEPDVDLQDTVNSLYKLFEQICHSTFLVTDQVRHLIKVELGSKKRSKDAAEDEDTKPGQKFKCPEFKATVRLIATEGLVGRNKVRAYFCHEDTLNELNKTNSWDTLETASFPLNEKGRVMPLGQQGYANFRKLELTQFRRDPDKHVCEEKYRIVFTTEQKVAGRTFTFRTLSLPIIITTGASQGSNAHGSLLWQCYSVEDLMEFPLQSPSELPWSTVSSMLNQKFKTLGGRNLRTDELLHLASRVSGLPKTNITPKTEIQFRKFCLDKMMDVKESKDAKNKSATFWMWVLSVYNLTNFYLRDYWTEDLIDGFSTKEDCDKKLKSMHPFKPYTFLLRFSDTVITDGQGQNMCGAISAAFVYKTEDGEIKVGHARPFKAEIFKKKILAQLVKSVHLKENEGEEVSLKYIYPGRQTRDEAFQSFYQPSNRKKDQNYIEFEERLYARLRDLCINEHVVPKEEPSNDLPVNKKSKQSSTEEVPVYQYPEQPQFADIMSMDKFEQPSPSSTLFGGDHRNSSESTPFSQEQSPASSYMMSPDNRFANGYSVTSPQGSISNNGMHCSVTSPQSSIDESQVLSPEQEAGIPVTVLDEIGSNGAVVNGNLGYNQAANQVYFQSGPAVMRSNSLPEQHPTLTTLLTNRSASEELRNKIMAKRMNQQPITSHIDLNSVRDNNTVDLTSLAISLGSEYSGEISLQNTMAVTMETDYPGEDLCGDNITFEEVIIPGDGIQNPDENTLTQEQLEQFEEIQQQLGSVVCPTDNMQQQLHQIITDPQHAQQFTNLLNVMSEYMNLPSTGNM